MEEIVARGDDSQGWVASWLTFYLKQPHRLFPGTLMPDPDLFPDELNAVVAFSLRLDDPEFVRGAVSPYPAAP